jgi:hypothetical protein
MKHTIKILSLCAVAFLASCASKKAAVGEQKAKQPSTEVSTSKSAQSQLAFVQKVSDNKVYAQNIVAGLSFNAKMGDKDVTVPGSLRMRKDQVIRLQLFIPILGSEVGRLEFTPTYVLVVDRMHKEYMKGDYNQLDFLKKNGLNFYSLQALFWNQLFLPGNNKVGELDLQNYDVRDDEMGSKSDLVLKNGAMSFVWKADKTSGRIDEANVSYTSSQHGTSNLVWKYGNFRALGSKLFPMLQEFIFTTTAKGKAQKLDVTLDMDDLKTTDGWDANTTVSSKYKEVKIEDVFGKLLNK